MSISGVNRTKGLRLAIDVREKTDYRCCPLDWAWLSVQMASQTDSECISV